MTIKKALMLVALIFSISQCGQKGKEFNIKVSVDPENPVVILADFKYDSDPSDPDNEVISVTAPWAYMRMSIENDGTEAVTVQSLIAEVVGRTATGAEVKGTTTFAPQDLVPPGANTILGTVSPGGNPLQVTLYLGSMPKAASTVYRVTMRLQGWFGTEFAPTDKLEKSFTFITK